MKLCNTTGDFARYCRKHEERVENLVEAGFKYIDLNMYSIVNEPSFFGDMPWEENAKKLQEYTNSLGATFVQAHSPGINALDVHENSERDLAATIRSVEVCGVLGIPNIVVHSGWATDISKEEWFEKNAAFFRKLFPAAEKWGVNVLCENSTAANMGDRYYTNTGKDMYEFVEFVNHPLFGACWDTGHGNIEGPQYDEILAIGKHLKAVHINDNRGKADDHIIPLMGTLNMDEIMHALVDVKFKGYFTFECESLLLPMKTYLYPRHEFKEDKLSSPQLFMQKHLTRLMYEIGEWSLREYDIFEE